MIGYGANEFTGLRVEMEITLMRHGQPTITRFRGSEKIKAAEMHAWIAGYDASDVTGHPPQEAKSVCDERDFILSSPLQRARSSLFELDAHPDLILDNLREAPLPLVALPWLKLSPHTWLIVFRLFWFLRLSHGLESRSAVQQRAKQATCDLIAAAKQRDRIFSMGHGLMNRLISRELERQGWKKTQGEGSGYWGWVTYVSPAD
ncbi:hypothetical protein AU510_04930 [Lonsdalea britannica]|nr:hypothetical protein AU510_04930 [Lonsdalea britannica]